MSTGTALKLRTLQSYIPSQNLGDNNMFRAILCDTKDILNLSDAGLASVVGIRSRQSINRWVRGSHLPSLPTRVTAVQAIEAEIAQRLGTKPSAPAPAPSTSSVNPGGIVSQTIFVFGSNEQGRHGAGAARAALNKFGAVWGQGVGLAGDSYAIPTCSKPTGEPDFEISLTKVEGYVNDFITFATQHPELEFQVTRIGCGFAGFTDDQIAPLFTNAPSNCLFDTAWTSLLPSTARFWGTF